MESFEQPRQGACAPILRLQLAVSGLSDTLQWKVGARSWAKLVWRVMRPASGYVRRYRASAQCRKQEAGRFRLHLGDGPNRKRAQLDGEPDTHSSNLDCFVVSGVERVWFNV